MSVPSFVLLARLEEALETAKLALHNDIPLVDTAGAAIRRAADLARDLREAL